MPTFSKQTNFKIIHEFCGFQILNNKHIGVAKFRIKVNLRHFERIPVQILDKSHEAVNLLCLGFCISKLLKTVLP